MLYLKKMLFEEISAVEECFFFFFQDNSLMRFRNENIFFV